MSGTGFFDYGIDGVASSVAPMFLADATVDDWAAVLAHSERRRFHSGDTVIRAGDVDRSLLIIMEGDLETVAERRGKRRRLSPAPAGSVVGELGFIDGKARSASVIALTDGELLRMSRSSFESLAAVNPHLGRMVLFDLAVILADRLRSLTEIVMAR